VGQKGPGNSTVLRLIALLKLVEGALLLGVVFGILTLLHKNVADQAERLFGFFHINTDTIFMQKILIKLELVDTRDIVTISVIAGLYAALVFVEGFGLWWQEQWAEYLTVAATGFFIPYEIIEVTKHAGAGNITLLAINSSIVVYLALVLFLRQIKPADKLEPGMLSETQNPA
jgi:uncharacterized membrane protein (DUF2068 family)